MMARDFLFVEWGSLVYMYDDAPLEDEFTQAMN